MTTMRVVQVPAAGADFQVVERQLPEPGPGEVRLRVQACGVCHSDMFAKADPPDSPTRHPRLRVVERRRGVLPWGAGCCGLWR